MLTLGFLFWAAGYRVGVAVLVAGYGIPQLLGKLTVILGSIGVVEATMAGLYTLLGAPNLEHRTGTPSGPTDIEVRGIR